MGRKTYHISRQPFVADLHTLVRNTGRPSTGTNWAMRLALTRRATR